MALYALGSNGSGQLGISHKEDVSVPKPASFDPAPSDLSIAKIAAGGNHTLVLLESGELYWSGDPGSGACGLTSGIADAAESSIFRPVKLADDRAAETFRSKKICNIAASWEASFIVTEDCQGKNQVYSFGSGQKGELGLGKLPVEVLRTPSATLIPEFPPEGCKVVDIAACMAHAVVVLENGDVYGWGNGRKGQLGEPSEIVQFPRKIAAPGLDFKITKAICGREFTCLISPADKGKIAVFGSDKWGIKTLAPKSITGWKDVQAGWSALYLLQSDGTLTSWGRDDHGQMVPPNLLKVLQMAIGSEHAVCLTEDGEAVCWGWGEHGNCGPSAENDVKGRWNVIASEKYVPSDLKIAYVGAGCATSWVNIRLATP